MGLRRIRPQGLCVGYREPGCFQPSETPFKPLSPQRGMGSPCCKFWDPSGPGGRWSRAGFPPGCLRGRPEAAAEEPGARMLVRMEDAGEDAGGDGGYWGGYW